MQCPFLFAGIRTKMVNPQKDFVVFLPVLKAITPILPFQRSQIVTTSVTRYEGDLSPQQQAWGLGQWLYRESWRMAGLRMLQQVASQTQNRWAQAADPLQKDDAGRRGRFFGFQRSLEPVKQRV